ncbi:hypothetical protein WJX84_010885 [Apatococcus fuscideae]|uniref:Uncharacterized protein n=1 Tax=Apatococcus fuscideae TaxID=2026836 RepID=A0AAW1SUW8_9CHLO
MRAVVKDSTDMDNGNSSQTWLDSDGQVANLYAPANNSRISRQEFPLGDGAWHHLALTTFPQGGRGFQMFIDGRAVGEMNPNNTYADETGKRHPVNGGNAMYLDGPLVLCARLSNATDTNRTLDGRLTQFGIFNQALNATQIETLYRQGPLADGTPPTKASTPASLATSKGQVLLGGVKLPTIAAYFPLSGDPLRSDATFSQPVFNGTASGMTMVHDPIAGSAIQCSQDSDTRVLLDDVTYGSNGSFAINVWVRPVNLTGDSYQYIFSHGLVDRDGADPWQANQVQMYIPETGTGSFGVVRTLVKDSSDSGSTTSAFSFLDSNGLVGWVNSSQAAKTGSNLEIGQTLQARAWLMLTLTTHPSGGKGFQIWINGVLLADEAANGAYQREPVVVDGLTLCFLPGSSARRNYLYRCKEPQTCQPISSWIEQQPEVAAAIRNDPNAPTLEEFGVCAGSPLAVPLMQPNASLVPLPL